jgi:osmotically-inducible protein OsmY
MRIGKIADLVILNRIQERIRWDKRISEADVRAMVGHGEVILIGVVDSHSKKDAAYEIAMTTAGVLNVDNQITVQDRDFRDDGEIRRILHDQLASIGLQAKEHVFIDVVDGVVKLEGLVFSAATKARAVSVAWELSGVRDCLNLIEIGDPIRFKERHQYAGQSA